jgi:outer membrane protein assembly factor BamB
MGVRCKVFRFGWRFAVVWAVVSVFAGTTSAQEQSVILRPGIVVDVKNKLIYAMTPEGISAIDLTSGTSRWKTTAAAKPLAVTNDLLISQIEPKTRTNRLELVTLDTKNSSVTMRSVAELPTSVKVGIGQTLEGKFDAEAQMLADGPLVTWKFERRPLRGRLEESSAKAVVVPPPQIEASSLQAAAEGALRLNLTTGAVSNVDVSLLGSTFNREWTLNANEKVSGAPPTQYQSADKRHIMASERVADEKTWAKYRWTIFDRTTNKRIGEFRTHLAFAPFLISNSTLIYETTPYINAGKQEPAKVRGVNLATGQEIWNVEVREVTFRGPFPP